MRLAGLLIGVTAIFIFGLVDDRLELTQQAAVHRAVPLRAPRHRVHHLDSEGQQPLHQRANRLPLAGGGALTIFWFTGMMNTVNWLDGLDGLAAGVSCIVAAFICIHMLREGQLSVALLPLALVGATLGFLPYNFNPAKIFMGSGGSYFLGWAVAALGIIGGAKVATVLLAMGLPILDVAWLIYNRWRNQGHPTQNGRDHLHHRLLDIGFTQRQIVLSYYAFCAIFGALALLLENRLYKVIALAVLGRGGVRRARVGRPAAGGQVRQRAPERTPETPRLLNLARPDWVARVTLGPPTPRRAARRSGNRPTRRRYGQP